MNLVETRKNGIGNGFTVINPKDGYRKDNAVWFGECSKCGEMVSSSSVSLKFNGWTHTLIRQEKGYQVHTAIDYCPKGQQPKGLASSRKAILRHAEKIETETENRDREQHP